ncbi:hypothetical protein [Crocosphaera sp. XPORK-15E]|uniref:hypothetical protein n=1 Tax=Crocosphaera sp. XPORK-15E TaxID=3110247 RepID=UPI002B1F6210|nr:hypothetical protein [Crocosphaera sp. XPORK-15E]MEA5536929.1 hypothetical protein [Crocosphaera sp. XPORK-15E]
MDEITQKVTVSSLLPEEVSKQLKALGISPEDLSEQFVALDLSLDEVAKKIASVGIPSLILVAILTNFAGPPIVTTLATSLTGTIGVIGDTITGYTIEIILVNFYLERLKAETLEDLSQEIEILPLTDALKGKLKDRLSKEKIPKIIRTITIVED